MAYDALGRMTSQQSPFNLTQTYIYDAAGDRVRVLDSLGGTQVSSYDATGRLTSRTQGGSGQTPLRTDLTYTPDGQVATQTDTATAAQDLGGLDTATGTGQAYVAQHQNTSLFSSLKLAPVNAPDAANLGPRHSRRPSCRLPQFFRAGPGLLRNFREIPQVYAMNRTRLQSAAARGKLPTIKGFR